MRDWWSKKISGPLMAELNKGTDPRLLARAAAVGAVTAIFPVLGITSFLGVLIGLTLKLNQVALIAVNYLFYPLQWVLIPVYIRLGERIFGLGSIPLDPTVWRTLFNESPRLFFTQFGQSIGAGVLAWLVSAPFLLIALERFVFFPIFKRLERSKPAQP